MRIRRSTAVSEIRTGSVGSATAQIRAVWSVGPSAVTPSVRSTGRRYLDHGVTYTRLASRSGSRRPSSASEWVARNPKKLLKHKGRWVAVAASGIVAFSGDFDDVFILARKKGFENPLVFKVPSDHKPRVVSVRQ